MRKYTYKLLFALLSISSILFIGCDDDGGYDFDAIVPIVQGFEGPTAAFASGGGFVEYKVIGRGGSTFEYSVSGIGATIVKSEEETSAKITFAQSDVDVNAVVSVVETTYGGVASEPVSINVSLKKFKPMAITEFYGNWTGVGYKGEVLDFEVVAGAVENQLLLKAVGRVPALYHSLFTGWGEDFQVGIGQEADIFVDVNLDNGGLSVLNQYFGQTEPGPWDYYLDGSGLWDGFTKSMTLTITVGDNTGWYQDPDGTEFTMTKTN